MEIGNDKSSPLGHDQSQNKRVEDALSGLRMRGLWTEASVLSLEIKTLRDELESLRNLIRGSDVQP